MHWLSRIPSPLVVRYLQPLYTTSWMDTAAAESLARKPPRVM